MANHRNRRGTSVNNNDKYGSDGESEEENICGVDDYDWFKQAEFDEKLLDRQYFIKYITNSDKKPKNYYYEKCIKCGYTVNPEIDGSIEELQRHIAICGITSSDGTSSSSTSGSTSSSNTTTHSSSNEFSLRTQGSSPDISGGNTPRSTTSLDNISVNSSFIRGFSSLSSGSTSDSSDTESDSSNNNSIAGNDLLTTPRSESSNGANCMADAEFSNDEMTTDSVGSVNKELKNLHIFDNLTSTGSITSSTDENSNSVDVSIGSINELTTPRSESSNGPNCMADAEFSNNEMTAYSIGASNLTSPGSNTSSADEKCNLVDVSIASINELTTSDTDSDIGK